MFFLYLGFMLGQSYSVIQVIYQADLPLLTILFSILVFLIWSFIPVLGYVFARYFFGRPILNRWQLSAAGLMISLFEKSLYSLELVTRQDGYLSIAVTSGLFLALGLIPFFAKLKINKTELL